MGQIEEAHAGAIAPAEAKSPIAAAAAAAVPSPIGSDDGKDAIAPAEPTGKKGISGFFHWHEPGTSKKEKKLIFKLDWFLLSFSCLTYFLKQVCKIREIYTSPRRRLILTKELRSSWTKTTYQMPTCREWPTSSASALGMSSPG